MSPVWLPYHPPPCNISALSPAAETVWQAMLGRHREKIRGHDPVPTQIHSDYYQAIYARKFGALPEACGHSSLNYVQRDAPRISHGPQTSSLSMKGRTSCSDSVPDWSCRTTRPQLGCAPLGGSGFYQYNVTCMPDISCPRDYSHQNTLGSYHPWKYNESCDFRVRRGQAECEQQNTEVNGGVRVQCGRIEVGRLGTINDDCHLLMDQYHLRPNSPPLYRSKDDRNIEGFQNSTKTGFPVSVTETTLDLVEVAGATAGEERAGTATPEPVTETITNMDRWLVTENFGNSYPPAGQRVHTPQACQSQTAMDSSPPIDLDSSEDDPLPALLLDLSPSQPNHCPDQTERPRTQADMCEDPLTVFDKTGKERVHHGQSSDGELSTEGRQGVDRTSNPTTTTLSGGELVRADQMVGLGGDCYSRKRSLPKSPMDRNPRCLGGTGLTELPKQKVPRSRKPVFNAPMKKTAKSDSIQSMKPISGALSEQRPVLQQGGRLEHVKNISLNDKSQLLENLKAADEVALTLIMSDGSTKLRPSRESNKRRMAVSTPKVEGVALAYPKKASNSGTSLAFLKIPFASIVDDNTSWVKNMIAELMSGRTRKLCYGAHELIVELLNNQVCSVNTAVTQWSVMDPAVAHWLLDSDHPPTCFKDVLAGVPHLKQVLSATCVTEEAVCEDLTLLGPVMVHLYHQLRTSHLWRLYLDVETPLTTILAAMDRRGILVDTRCLLDVGQLLGNKLSQLEQEAHTAAKRKFSLNSHAQLRQVLFEDLKLDQKLSQKARIARTLVRNQKSTSEGVLVQLQGTHPLPAIVLEYRQLQKLKSTYVDGMLACVRQGQLYTHWDQVAAATGRLASTHPNIQAIPKQPVIVTKRNQTGGEAETVEVWARDAFISRQRCVFLAADFQQVELRILAHLAADPALLEIFTTSQTEDIFVHLTSQWLDKSAASVTSADREQTKRVVYSIMYGAGKERLAEYLKIPADDAKCIIDSFLVRFPGVNSFTRSCVSEARNNGYQRTIFGRRRQLAHITHPSGQLRAQAERQAVNFCVQGCAADLCKIAMLQVERALATKPHVDARLLVQVHDELILEVSERHLAEVAHIVSAIMSDASALCGHQVELRVPLEVALSVGTSWGHMKPYKLETLGQSGTARIS